eukprot:gnl/TRDRNA2_/TRDRNA2_45859_c0_seq2.p1 gnl/TRDRNA2_/TRDRNA2_45859_c0~~gnl/TRDRNA2_/TRDRNA2_45859_c0_seq2.p1  ORF type:complete len:129 (+),score=24.57 gnl/TRDRNA2_/TRDRNA2_45859_c0_seq2:118-504(+)
MLDAVPQLEYIGVDPFAEHMYKMCMTILAPHAHRARIHRLTGELAAPLFEDGELDLIWVDGNHDYEFVVKDLRLYIPKLRSGGVVAGHNYCEATPGVVRAVQEVFAEHPAADGVLHLAPDYTYMWQKT